LLALVLQILIIIAVIGSLLGIHCCWWDELRNITLPTILLFLLLGLFRAIISSVSSRELPSCLFFFSLGEIISLYCSSLWNTFCSSYTGHNNLSIILLWQLFLSEIIALTGTIAVWSACRRRLRTWNDLVRRLICLNADGKNLHSSRRYSFFFGISTLHSLSWLLRRWILKRSYCIDWKCFSRRYLALLGWGRISRIQLISLLPDWKNLIRLIVNSTIWACCLRSHWNLRCFLRVYGVIPFIA